jgi:hypothetical protein
MMCNRTEVTPSAASVSRQELQLSEIAVDEQVVCRGNHNHADRRLMP